MALIKCHECGKDVSTEAKACPSCGAKVINPNQVKPKSSKTLLLIAGVAAIGIVVASKQTDGPSQAALDLRQEIGLAEAVCQIAAEKAANDPSSIEWIRNERKFTFLAADKSKALSIQPMRANNKAGAKIRTIMQCEVSKHGSSWIADRLTEAH